MKANLDDLIEVRREVKMAMCLMMRVESEEEGDRGM